LHRRHLSQEQKRELIEKLLKAKPAQSNNVTAKLAKVSDKTVARVRGKLEATSEIPKLDTRAGADGRTRPASQPKHEPLRLHYGPPTKKPRALQRDETIVALAKLLHEKLPETLTDIASLLRDEQDRIAALPDHKRGALARLFLIALDINDHTALAAAHAEVADA
jgi:hypothetical protein